MVTIPPTFQTAEEKTTFPFGLCGFETWSLTWRKEHGPKLHELESKVLRKTFGPNKNEG
jgi:hypothetical protein